MHRRSCDPKRWFEWGTAGDEWRWPSEFDMQLWQSTRESESPPAKPGFNRCFFWNSNWWVCGISSSQVTGKIPCVYTRYIISLGSILPDTTVLGVVDLHQIAIKMVLFPKGSYSYPLPKKPEFYKQLFEVTLWSFQMKSGGVISWELGCADKIRISIQCPKKYAAGKGFVYF